MDTFRTKYSSQHRILKHPQPMFLPQFQQPNFIPTQNNRQNYSSISYNHMLLMSSTSCSSSNILYKSAVTVGFRCLYEGCGKHYYSLNSLNSHSRSHQHKEEEVRCQWEGCGKLFDKPCRLKAHMRSHTGDKPYPCLFPVTVQFVLSFQSSP
jgi:uncharacterized Zn-finger protein